MAAIALPAPVPPLPEWSFSPAADELGADLRVAARATSDVADWGHTSGRPGDWQGADADAAGRAAAEIATATDGATVALERVTRACEIYVGAMTQLGHQRDDLVERRRHLNEELLSVEHTGSGLPADDPELPRLQRIADNLTSAVSALKADIDDWETRVIRVEDRLIRAFQNFDSVAEAAAAAVARDGVDTAALLDAMATKGSPAAVAAWWRTLSQAERDALLHDHPDKLGNTNGIPSVARDDANRRSLADDLEYLRGLEEAGELSDEQKQLLANAEAAEEALGKGTLPDGTTVDTYLLAYDPSAFDGDGAVAVSFGNPDLADNTAVSVPGTTHSASSIPSQANDALALYQESSGNGSVATIAWIGYDAPSKTGSDGTDDLLGVADEAKAEEGGRALSDYIDGLRATDSGERSHLTVIGHSYGATTAAHAATDGLDTDRLVLIGSPGAGGGSDHVSDLNLPEGSVFVGSAENDPITWLGRRESDPIPGSDLPVIGDDIQRHLEDLGLGQDPSQESFGATRFNVADGDRIAVPDLDLSDIDGGDFKDLIRTVEDNHGSYYEGESLENLGSIVTGGTPDIVDGRDRPANDYLFDTLEEELREEVRDEVRDRIINPVREGYDRYIDDPIVDPLENAGEAVVDGTREVLTDPVGTFNDAWEALPG